jgi:hypothetical protein
MEKCLSLDVRDKVISDLKEITGYEFSVYFNDLYKRKDGTCRRLKGGFIGAKAVHKSIWTLWKQKLEGNDYGLKVEFDCLDYYKSNSKARFINTGYESIAAGYTTYEDYFNSDDCFIIRIIFNN